MTLARSANGAHLALLRRPSNGEDCPNPALAPGETEGPRRVENNVLVSARYGRPRARVDALPDAQGVSDPSRSKEVATAEIVDC